MGTISKLLLTTSIRKMVLEYSCKLRFITLLYIWTISIERGNYIANQGSKFSTNFFYIFKQLTNLIPHNNELDHV